MKEIFYVAHMNVRGNPYGRIEPFKDESTIFCVFNLLASVHGLKGCHSQNMFLICYSR